MASDEGPSRKRVEVGGVPVDAGGPIVVIDDGSGTERQLGTLRDLVKNAGILKGAVEQLSAEKKSLGFAAEALKAERDCQVAHVQKEMKKREEAEKAYDTQAREVDRLVNLVALLNSTILNLKDELAVAKSQIKEPEEIEQSFDIDGMPRKTKCKTLGEYNETLAMNLVSATTRIKELEAELESRGQSERPEYIPTRPPFVFSSAEQADDWDQRLGQLESRSVSQQNTLDAITTVLKMLGVMKP